MFNNRSALTPNGVVSPLRRSWISTLLALAAVARFYGRGAAPRIVSLSGRRTYWTKPHQGVQEMARRRRQIARGMYAGLVAA